MRVLILNTCSTLNRGDAAIVLGQIHLLQKLCPGVRIALTSKTPALDRAFYDSLGVEVLPPLTPALSSYQGIGRKLSEGARALVAVGDKRRLIQAVRRSDLVLSCGGGYFYSYRSVLPGTTFWQNVLHAYLATALHKPLIFLPQSFGPFASSLARRGVRHLLERMSVVHIFPREEVSHRLLRQMLGEAMQAKITLCPDMAFYLTEGELSPIRQGEAPDLPQPTLMMNLREWAFPEAEDPASRRAKRADYLEAMVAVAHCFVQRYRGGVVVVPQALGPDPSEDDRGICMEFYQRLCRDISTGGVVHYREPETSSLSGYLELLSQATILVGTRLHSCILALSVGVPVVSVGYQQKSQGTLDLLGLGRFNANMSDVTSAWLLAAVDEIVAQRQEIQEEIVQRLDQARRQIDEQVGGLLRAWATGAGEYSGE
jgi:colanic acid/amylovoran biosynthesis protein